MRIGKAKVVMLALFVSVLLSLILAGCSLTGADGDPYTAGQRARTEFDQTTEQAGDFVAGFCSTAPLPVAALGLIVVLRRTRPR